MRDKGAYVVVTIVTVRILSLLKSGKRSHQKRCRQRLERKMKDSGKDVSCIEEKRYFII